MTNPKQWLIENWKKAYKFLSVQLAVVLVLLDGAYVYLPEIQGFFPEYWHTYIAGAIIIARIIKQRGSSNVQPDP